MRIRNYTSPKSGIRGDIIQSALYELIGAIDPNAIATAVAISEGLHKFGKVYVVAHSQGSEIVREALDFIYLIREISNPAINNIFSGSLFTVMKQLMAEAFPYELYSYLLKAPLNFMEGTGTTR